MAHKSGRDTVAVGIVYGSFEPHFVFSLLALKEHDANGPRHLSHPGWVVSVAGTNLPQQRNKVATAFLDDTDAEWLWFVDTDQRFRYDIIDQLLESADPVERPIVSALVMAEKTNPDRIVPACLGFKSIEPLIPVEYQIIPSQKLWQVGGVGTGCVLIHRTVFEKMREATKGDAWPFFKYLEWDAPDDHGGTKRDILGEDYSFSLRAQALGFPVYVDTTIEAGHIKKRSLTSRHFWEQVPDELIPDRTFVVIPVKDNLKDTKQLLRSLHAQGGYDEIVVLDNGSNPETKRWLDRQTFAKVIDAEGKGIHEMWNIGAAYALAVAPKANIAFLNNDIRIGDNFLEALATGLRSSADMVAVCPNYDGRDPGPPVELLHGICAERYDGTGGLSGFAFMVKGEWFASGWWFPEDCKWWYGDNDLTLSIDEAGGYYGMVHATTVEHLDGGGKTGDWSSPEMQPQLEADRKAFLKRWAKRGVQVA